MNKLPDSISIVWHIDDVKSLDSTLSDQDCKIILQTVQRKHDCNIGITWDFIQYYIDEYKGG